MAGFCANCGGRINDGDRVCGNCGTPVGGMVPSMGGAPVQAGPMQGGPAMRGPQGGPAMRGPVQGGPKKASSIDFKKFFCKENKNKLIGIGAVSLVALIAIIVVVAIVVSNSGYKKALKKAVKGIENIDTEQMYDVTSHLLTDYCDDRDKDLENYYDDFANSLIDQMDSNCGNIKSLSFEITEEDEMTDRQFDKAMEYFEDKWDINTEDIKKVVDVEIKIICKGSKKTKEYKGYHFFAIKESGGWKLIYNKHNNDLKNAISDY